MDQDQKKDKAIAVAGVLPAPWRFNYLYDQIKWARYQIIGPGGMSFGIDSQSYQFRGKFHVQGLGHSINISYDRKPQAIARDIEKRFIPEYLRLFENNKESKDKSNQKQEHFNHIKNMFLKLLPGSYDQNGHSNHRQAKIVKSMGWNECGKQDSIVLEANAYYIDRCDINLNLSIEDGVKVIGFLNSLGVFTSPADTESDSNN